MTKFKKLFFLLLGIPIHFLSFLVPRKKNLIIFGGGNGDYYSDNSKYLFEYYLKNSNKECWWITRSSKVYSELKSEKKPALLNQSFSGLAKILQASTVIFCTSRVDILFVYLKSDRRIINLFHAMPLKKIVYDYDGQDQKRGHLFDKLWNKYVAGFKWEDTEFTLSTSIYFNSVIKSAFKTGNIRVVGMPRNDFFFEEQDHSDLFLKEVCNNKLVISYLPTHRKFGFGRQPTTPFIDNQKFQDFLSSKKAVLVHKPHYNVATHYNYKSESIYEIGPGEIDVQELLKRTDILITDYSSCYIDYLLLDRPIIFYRYDNYTENDTGVYQKIEKHTESIGAICSSEDELKKAIYSLLNGADAYQKTRSEIKHLFHKYRNGQYSKRVYEAVEDIK